jgi:hypothetical protein
MPSKRKNIVLEKRMEGIIAVPYKSKSEKQLVFTGIS